MSEIWMPCPGFEGFYEVSSHGAVRRTKRAKGATVGAVLRQLKSPRGYYSVMLSRGSKMTRRLVNRLVCEAFHGKPPSPSHQAAHRNGKPADNRQENLRWATRSENQQDRREHGTYFIRHRLPGSKNHKAKLAEADIPKVKALYATGLTQAQVGKHFGISQISVSRIIRGTTWAHV